MDRSAIHVVFFIRNVVKMCTVAIFRFCTVVSYFFPGILDSRFLVVYENMQKKILTITKWSMAKFSLCMKLNLDMLMSI